jgi:diadenosine tetraphosphatase ApaH/serine/threonine PP2A family protein phosphatase
MEDVGEDKKHYMQCPDCKKRFDIRDLREAFLHHHWLKRLPDKITTSHVTQSGDSSEYYIKSGRRVTLRLLNGGNIPPGMRA